MSRTTFRSQVLFLCHSRAKRRIPVPLLSPRLFPFPRGKGLGVRLSGHDAQRPADFLSHNRRQLALSVFKYLREATRDEQVIRNLAERPQRQSVLDPIFHFRRSAADTLEHVAMTP